MQTPVLEARHISKRFTATQALDDVTIAFNAGEVHALIGENGAGKSTLMNIVGGIHAPDSGEVLLEGARLDLKSPHDALMLGIGFVHQELALCRHLSVAENVFMVELGAGIRLIDFAHLYRETERLLASFGSEVNPRQKVSELSVSQQQVVEIVKAISKNCRVLIFDEPTAALTQTETETLFRIIETLKAKGLCVIYISHRMSEIYRICDRVSVLRDGRLIDTELVSGIDQVSLVHKMVGRELTDVYPAKNERSDEKSPVLEVTGLTLDGVYSDVSFSLYHGEILGFAGLVGSGRTEVARTICGLYRRSAGETRLDGKLIDFHDYRDAISSGIVYLTEDRKAEGLFLEMSVASNISVIDLDAVSRYKLIDRSREHGLASRFVKEMGIKVAGVASKVRALSGGNQQKVLISKLLNVKPRVVLMDEPTRGIDIGAKTQIYHLLRRLASEGVGVVMISSELPEIIGVCDRVAVMYEGTIRGVLAGDEINEQAIIRMACLDEN
ncbi:MAG TPA: sugar ABC transporter ATP-binding protein [Spirochaetia bacterium]|nr:sugar ABC transporter ATP-binding protein [Spirochaetia bacterium]